MIEINGRKLCEYCFEEASASICPSCGYNSKDSAPDPTLLAPGSILRERYAVGHVIGKGGFGITYLAYDAVTNRKVAVKEYCPYGIAHRSSADAPVVSVMGEENREAFELGLEKFCNEAKLVMKFSGNPGIASVYELFGENGTVYFSMEYLRGRTLKEYIREMGTLDAPRALFLAKSVALSLEIVHSASVLHRDISPDNIIICNNGDIKLIDFGAARQFIAEHTQMLSAILKPGFAPPEQYSKKGNQGPWTDVYSLGTTLYYAMTGDIPEEGPARFDKDDTFVSNQFDIDPEIWAVISKSTKLKAEERYRDAFELKKALDSIPIKEEPLSVPSGSVSGDFAESEADFALKISRNTAGLPISIKTEQSKRSFLQKHLRTIIEAVCGLAAAGVIGVLAVKVYNMPSPDTGNSDSKPSLSSNQGNFDSGVEIPERSRFDAIGFDKPFYSCMNDSEKELYESIYYGILNGEEKIHVPSRKFVYDEVASVYYRMMYDNPQFTDAQDFSIIYNDVNGNRKWEANEYVSTILPNYIDVDPAKMKEQAKAVLDSMDKTDIAGSLCSIHDKLIDETKILLRYYNATCTYSYGAIVDHKADDLGFARAFCYYAQELGVYSYVIDGKFNGENRAWVRLKLDGSWYNVDVYGDAVAGSELTKMPFDESGGKCHTFFLMGDEFIFANGYEAEKDNATLWINDDGGVSPNKNVFLQKDGENAHFADCDAAYALLLKKSAENYMNGITETEITLAQIAADDFYEKANEKYLSDLKEKYNINAERFEMKYLGDAVKVSLA